jgi:hypothetical protein
MPSPTHSPWSRCSAGLGSPIIGPTPLPCQGYAPPDSHPSDPHDLCQTEPLRPAKPAIHRQSQSLLGHAPKACTDLHDLLWAAPLRLAKPAIHGHSWSSPGSTPQPAQACTISAGPCPSGLPGQWSTGKAQSPLHRAHPSAMPGPCSKGPLDCLNDRPLPAGPWDPIHLSPSTHPPQEGSKPA